MRNRQKEKHALPNNNSNNNNNEDHNNNAIINKTIRKDSVDVDGILNNHSSITHNNNNDSDNDEGFVPTRV